MFASIKCIVGKHGVDRSRVWHDGSDFRASCKGCNRPLIKDNYKGWRPFDSMRDSHIDRAAHPKAGDI